MPSIVTYKYIKQNPDIMEYIRRADKALEALGYTEHSFPHVEKVAHTSAMILETLGYDERTVELARMITCTCPQVRYALSFPLSVIMMKVQVSPLTLYRLL